MSEYSHNYLVEKKDIEPTYNPNTIGIGEVIDLKISVYSDGQHDGRLWDEKDVWWRENEIIDKIMQEIRTEVEALVRKVKPLRVHGV